MTYEGLHGSLLELRLKNVTGKQTKRANEGNGLIWRLADTSGMRFSPCISVRQREGDLSAGISWLLNYILAHPRPMEASITLVQDVTLSTKNLSFSGKALSQVVRGQNKQLKGKKTHSCSSSCFVYNCFAYYFLKQMGYFDVG